MPTKYQPWSTQYGEDFKKRWKPAANKNVSYQLFLLQLFFFFFFFFFFYIFLFFFLFFLILFSSYVHLVFVLVVLFVIVLSVVVVVDDDDDDDDDVVLLLLLLLFPLLCVYQLQCTFYVNLFTFNPSVRKLLPQDFSGSLTPYRLLNCRNV